jgi:hypothetical protein
MLDVGLPQQVDHYPRTGSPASPRPLQNIPALIADIRQEWGTMVEALGAADGTRKGDLLSTLGVLVSYDPLTRKGSGDLPPKSK